MSLCTKQIDLTYHLFCYKVFALKIEVIFINANNWLVYQFTKGSQKGEFELAQKDIMKWYIIKGRELWSWGCYASTHSALPIRISMSAWYYCANMVICTSVIYICTHHLACICTYIRAFVIYTCTSLVICTSIGASLIETYIWFFWHIIIHF